MANKASSSEGEAGATRQFNFGTVRFFQEFWVDILGGVVPGLVFLIGMLAALGVPTAKLFSRLDPVAFDATKRSFPEILKSVVQASGTFWFFIFTTLFVLTYVFGHLFYRRDPKDPDRASFHKLQREEMQKALAYMGWVFKREALAKRGNDPMVSVGIEGSPFESLVIKDFDFNWLQKWWLTHVRGVAPALRIPILSERQKLELKQQLEPFMEENHGAGKEDTCEYPYPQFHVYLKKRKLDYLVDLVGWAMSGPAVAEPEGRGRTVEPRSKLYINILKARLAHLYPDRNKTLLRNEAHIRLASGLWHACGTLRPLAFLGVALTLLSRIPMERFWVVPVVVASGIFAWAVRKRVGIAVSLSGLAVALVVYAALGWPFRFAMPGAAHVFEAARGFVAAEFWTLVTPITAFTLSLYFRAKIETFIHYQRMREVQQVLEAAYFSFRHERWLLSPPFDQFANHGRRSSPRRSLRRSVTVWNKTRYPRLVSEFRGVSLDVSRNGEGAGLVLWDGPLAELKAGDTLEVEVQGDTPKTFTTTAKHVRLDKRVAHVGVRLNDTDADDLLHFTGN